MVVVMVVVGRASEVVVRRRQLTAAVHATAAHATAAVPAVVVHQHRHLDVPQARQRDVDAAVHGQQLGHATA